MVDQDAEHHRIEFGDQIRLCGQRLEEFAEHSLSPFPFGDLIFKLIMALLQTGISDKKNTLIERLDHIIRTDAEIEEALDLIDQEILIDELNVEKEICDSCRSIWKTLQKRRINRGDL